MKNIFDILFIVVVIIIILVVGLLLTVKLENIKAETALFKSMTELNEVDIKATKLYLSSDVTFKE